MKIININAYQVYDSRGYPTVEAVVELENGIKGVGLVPSGASTGQYEAIELRDENQDYYLGKSVHKAIDNIHQLIAPLIVGLEVDQQEFIDKSMCELDGTKNKSRLGANAILAVSLAVSNAAAQEKGIPLYEYLGGGEGVLLPLPEIQLIGGGAHAQWRTDIQDFLLIVNGASTYEQAIEVTHNIYHQAASLLKQRGKLFGLADEGGFWPEFNNNDEIFEFVIEAITVAGYKPGKDVSISLDIAASDLYENGQYYFRSENQSFTKNEFYQLMASWCEKYPILSIEDPFSDTDWENWIRFTKEFGHKVQIIGDDLFTTNIDRIKLGIEQKAANSVLIKLNQIGTVSETLKAIELTQNAGWLPVVSARSGETEDTFISHLAVATNAGQLKVGSFARSERMAKWNEVIRIHHQLGEKSEFIGEQVYKTIF